ncbi:MAG TPA: peptide ABC transporter substrate-binding protein [Dehalococcoidia bacterium]|nr:peptide ABC transporter substrate-binding protein [Dehalococcoidia bacterium]
MKFTARRNLISVILVLLLVVVWACGGEKTPAVPVDESAALKIRLRNDPTHLDPQRANSASDLGISRQLFRGLLWYDEGLNLIPMAAKEVPTEKNGGIRENGLLYTLKLKDGLKWSDGAPLTAADFEYSIKRLFDPALEAPRAAAYYDIKGAERYNTCKGCPEIELTRLRNDVGVKAEDATTLVLTLKNPRATILNLMAEPAFLPVRKDVVEKHGDKWTDPANFVGNGPFVLKERVLKERLVLAPNPNWWGSPSKVSSVILRIIPDNLDAFNAYLADDLDVVDVPPDQRATVERHPVLAKENTRLPLLETFAYFFNNRTPPFDNVQVRQAFALALDRDAFVSEVLYGVGRPAYSWLPPASPGHNDELGLQWKLNPSKARATLADAGYPGGAGLPQITVAYQTSGLSKIYAEFLQRQLSQNLAVQIELTALEPAAWNAAFNGGQYAIVANGWSFGGDPESSLVEIFGCQKYDGNNCAQLPRNNVTKYSNPEVDRIMQQATKERNAKRRATYYAKAEAIVVEDSPAVFMNHVIRNLLVKPRVRDLKTSQLDSLFSGQYFLERAYIAAE